MRTIELINIAKQKKKYGRKKVVLTRRTEGTGKMDDVANSGERPKTRIKCEQADYYWNLIGREENTY